VILVLRGKGNYSVDHLRDEVVMVPILRPVVDEESIGKLIDACRVPRRIGVVMSAEVIDAIRGRLDLTRCISLVIGVGPSTCGAVASLFPTIRCVMPPQFFSGGVSALLKQECAMGEEVLVMRSKDYAEEASITAPNCRIMEFGLYELIVDDEAIKRAASLLKDASAVVFTSPKVFLSFLSIVGRDSLKSKRLVAIGPTTGAAMIKNGFNPLVPPRFTIRDAVETALER
jgi:uroporphyrinogen III methyltransferase/synthase